MIRSPCNPQENFFSKTGEIIIQRTHHNTSDSLKASMVAPFAYMITAPGDRWRLRSPSPTTALESNTSPRQRMASSIFLSLSSSIGYYHEIKKKQDNNFIFECVREKLFLSRFIVTTLYISQKVAICCLWTVCPCYV